jgi:uncharacterized protein (TIGR00645 family)
VRSRQRVFARLLFIGRWLAAPFLLGLFLALLLLLYRFFADLYRLALQLPTQGWHGLVVGVLDLVDIALVGNLLLIVIFSGWENYIQKTEREEHADWPPGLIDVDFGALKQRLVGSIAVIAAVDALAWYLDLDGMTDLTKLGWVIGFPVMFALVMVLLAFADWLGRRARQEPK